MIILDRLEPLRALVDRELDAFLPGETERPEAVHRAMRYSSLARGKRLRPILAILTARIFRGETEEIAPVAAAIELIHSYSLIHDDLPCMDDDDLRRGVPTCHKAFGEAVAVLAGDALLTCAFEMILANGRKHGFSAEALLSVISELSRAAGSRGMIAGQIEDIQSEGKEIDPDLLRYIHHHKTGCLFTASVRVGAILAGAGEKGLDDVSRFGDIFGQAFQITDDILDVEGDSAVTGKPQGSDQQKAKATYPRLFTLEKSKQMAREQVDEAAAILAPYAPASDDLIALVRYLPDRTS